jgi:hypothetical protein
MICTSRSTHGLLLWLYGVCCVLQIDDLHKQIDELYNQVCVCAGAQACLSCVRASVRALCVRACVRA